MKQEDDWMNQASDDSDANAGGAGNDWMAQPDDSMTGGSNLPATRAMKAMKAKSEAKTPNVKAKQHAKAKMQKEKAKSK